MLLGALLLGSCGGGDDKVECAVKGTESFFCSSNTKVYVCPAGTAADAAANAAIDAACQAAGGSNMGAVAQCTIKAMQDGKYRTAPARLVEDCAATNKTCDVFTSTCVAP